MIFHARRRRIEVMNPVPRINTFHFRNNRAAYPKRKEWLTSWKIALREWRIFIANYIEEIREFW